MGRKKQLAFRYLSKIEKIGVEKKPPQPHLAKYREIKKYEILHRPFDLKFRGRINKWLNRVDTYKIKPLSTLTKQQDELISLYFYPQGNNKIWMSQEDVIEKVPEIKIWKIRDELVETLLIIWEWSREDRTK